MKSCCKCGELLISGYILCSDCKEVMSTDLSLTCFIDQLAEDITLDYMGMCDLCVHKQCDGQQSGLTCRNGVKVYLLNLIPKYSKKINVEVNNDLCGIKKTLPTA